MVAKIKGPRRGLAPRNLTMPIAAFVMAGILYMYSVTSIRAAKRNAQLHREADGGQLDMRRESLRRHGVLDQVEGTKGLQLFREARASDSQQESEFMGEKKAKNLGPAGQLQQDQQSRSTEEQQQAVPRTQVESALEEYKGVGKGDVIDKIRAKKRE